MNRQELISLLSSVTTLITIGEPLEVEFMGTGVVLDKDGSVLTANHVVTDDDTKEVLEPVYIHLPKRGPTLYVPKSGMVNVSMRVKGVATLKFDVALLEPADPVEIESFIPVAPELAVEGDEVLMAGYSEDIKLPLDFDQEVNLPPSVEKKAKNFLESYARQTIIKSGMIGNRARLIIEDNENKGKVIKGAEYWIDNSFTCGASGGPVVNESGELIGVITQRGLTSVGPKNLSLSGTTRVLSHHIISARMSNG